MIEDDRPGVLERMLTSFVTDDMTVDLEHRTDADYLIALGMASRRKGSAAGVALRLKVAQIGGSLRPARNAVVDFARKMAAKRGWTLTSGRVRHIGEAAFMHHISPKCVGCSGTGYEKTPGAPSLSGKICKWCHGSGVKQIQHRNQKEIRAVLFELERIESLAEDEVKRLLR